MGQCIQNAEREKNHHPRILDPAKLPFQSEGEVKIFPDTQKPREFGGH